MTTSETRLSGHIQSIAISQSGERAVVLVNHDRAYSFELTGRKLGAAKRLFVPRPTQQGNRLKKIYDSSIAFQEPESVSICHIAGWNFDAKYQLNIQQLSLRTGVVSHACNVPCRLSFRCTAIPLGDDLLLVRCDEDAILLQVSQSRQLCTLRETLWEPNRWTDDDEEKPWEDNALPKQGVAFDPASGTVHALFVADQIAFVESYRWNERNGNFRCVKRQSLRGADGAGLCVAPAGTVGVWMTNRGEDIPIPPGGVEAIKDVELGKMIFLAGGKAQRVEVRSEEGDDFETVILDQSSTNEPNLLRIGTKHDPAYPFFSSETAVIVNTPSGRLVRIERDGESEELYRCKKPITAAAWSPESGRLLVGSGSNGTVTLLQLPAVQLPAGARRAPAPKIVAKPETAPAKKPAHVRRTEKRIRQMVADNGATAVYMTDGQLTELPEMLFEHKSWQRVGFGGNRVSRLPEAICGFSDLFELRADHNSLRTLPAQFGQLRKLETLDLSDNELTELPPSFCELTRLQVLNLSKNPIAQLPPEFGKLKQLRELNLQDCRLTQLPKSFEQLTALRELTLRNCPLGKVPAELRTLVRLEGLYLEGLQITKLPAWLGELKRLKNLALDHNRLTALPRSMLNMTRLGSLSLAFNDFTTVPEWIGQMKALWGLYLNHCKKLTSVPTSITKIAEVSVNRTPVAKLVGWDCSRLKTTSHEASGIE